MAIRWILSTVFCGLLLFPNLSQAAIFKAGDQATKPIADGFFIDSEVGLLTFLLNDGAKIYRPGLSVGFRFGGYLTKSFSLYGRIGGSVTGNTACYGVPDSSKCRSSMKNFPTARTLRGIPRQGMSLLAGVGGRWAFLELDERFKFHLSFELLGQVIPPDNIPADRLKKIGNKPDKKKQIKAHTEYLIGGAPGFGFGLEYFFLQKHFSVAADARYYFFLTKFMPGGSFMGSALLVSVGIKYTF